MKTSLHSSLAGLCLCFALAYAAFAQTANTGTDINITLREQSVRFAPTRSFQELRLEVLNHTGEIVFSHFTAEAEFDWNLRSGNGETLAPGLYSYVLTLKFGADQTRQQRGHFIVEKDQEQVWLTAQNGAEVSGSNLEVARTGGRSLAGFRTADDKQARREIEGREVAEEKNGNLNNLTKAVKREKAALLGTVNRLAKFDASGLANDVIDSSVFESGGKVGISNTTPQTRLHVGAGGAPVVTSGAALLVQEGPATSMVIKSTFGPELFFYQDPNLGVFGTVGAVPLQIRTSNVERMRVSSSGKVGIGTPTPEAQLDVLAEEGGAIRGTSMASSEPVSGVLGTSESNSGWGVVGVNYAETGITSGVRGLLANSTTTNASGVKGEANRDTGLTNGVWGTSVSVQGTGVYGTATSTSGVNWGVYGKSSSNEGFGVYGKALSSASTATLRAGVYGQAAVMANSYAGYFQGNVHVTGNLAKGSGSFKIDHPLDPENKYLYHSFVESPDMMNIYNGIVMLDQNGSATVALPEWFEALNQEFRYQLTSIGMPGPNLFIASEITSHQFGIAGGMPGAKVSWQVTGIRHDAFAQKHRIPTEELKSETDRGTYLHPEAFGKAAEKGLSHKLHAMRALPAQLGPEGKATEPVDKK